ncbi:MAG: hypothetical protein EB060_12765, partial [Proteobacteria bacterium]|nr:hypothetical protein [Pseudomonadota bacterium]
MALENVKKAKLEPLEIKILAALMQAEWKFMYDLGPSKRLHGLDYKPNTIRVEDRPVATEAIEAIFRKLDAAGVIPHEAVHVKTFGLPQGIHRAILPEASLTLLRGELKEITVRG